MEPSVRDAFKHAVAELQKSSGLNLRAGRSPDTVWVETRLGWEEVDIIPPGSFRTFFGEPPRFYSTPVSPKCDYCGRPNPDQAHQCAGCGAWRKELR